MLGRLDCDLVEAMLKPQVHKRLKRVYLAPKAFLNNDFGAQYAPFGYIGFRV